MAKGAAKAQGTDVAAAESRAERSTAEDTRATGAAGSAERYGMLPFYPARHAGGQSVIELRADAGYDTRQIFEHYGGLGDSATHQDKEERQQQGRGMGRTRGLAA